ncbi:hypothetical protein TEA_011287 [Camellia sinensis var. sinensis]|uniref:40S ribosomal protein S12 n=1 Tax=Camellia sinensis var. sinensis TaxID=542762 RepID=A0A4S4DYX2_CAMSN|nr:hypothetical protein TEA_011287 [Camellia sinensis var. sinensis]
MEEQKIEREKRQDEEHVIDMLKLEEVVVAAEAPAPAPALGEPMDIMTALQLVLRKSLAMAGLLEVFMKVLSEEVVVAAEAPAPAPALGEPMDIMTALQLVLRKSLAHGGVARGLHEGAKVIEKHAAQLCVLAEDCNQPDYVKLVKALCADHNVSLITVPSAKTLGEWAGLCKIDSEGKARKVVGCSCVVVKDYGEETEGLHIVQEYIKSH